ncbi:hypothetical protein XM38_015290 [Halomicronema hongdechloris C2206]|uniref:Uncharacterized protein n=1 Tax=Halomicronema hongdechloris C2206 TaxID=1641165 RepID=A0A1Z3HJU9_9CYAN|nr:type III secretion system chaperone [Halomicronema hongdechloris]ASC70589.1 hypothetical protein XM38_015290 [Halomicronema hongdechloris C2206]
MTRLYVSALTGIALWTGVSGVAMAQTSPPHDSAPALQVQETAAAVMTLERLEAILQDSVAGLQGEAGQWQFTLDQQSIVVLADEARDRMRIVTPIMPAQQLTPAQVRNVLVANFHTALDARYAVTDGTLVSVYVHPLSSLQADDLRSALQQVASLAANFGSTYSSDALIFDTGGSAPTQPVTPGESLQI